MGYQNGGSGQITEDNLLYHQANLIIPTETITPFGIDPDGKRIMIYKILITTRTTAPYDVQDSEDIPLSSIYSQWSGIMFFDLGLTPIPLATNNSDLYIYNAAATTVTFRTHLWYTLR